MRTRPRFAYSVPKIGKGPFSPLRSVPRLLSGRAAPTSHQASGLRFAPVLCRRVFLCTGQCVVHKKHNAHQSTSGPLPCTIEAITRSGTDTPSSRPTGPFSPNVGEVKFSEVHGSNLRACGAISGR